MWPLSLGPINFVLGYVLVITTSRPFKSSHIAWGCSFRDPLLEVPVSMVRYSCSSTLGVSHKTCLAYFRSLLLVIKHDFVLSKLPFDFFNLTIDRIWEPLCQVPCSLVFSETVGTSYAGFPNTSLPDSFDLEILGSFIW